MFVVWYVRYFCHAHCLDTFWHSVLSTEPCLRETQLCAGKSGGNQRMSEGDGISRSVTAEDQQTRK